MNVVRDVEIQETKIASYLLYFGLPCIIQCQPYALHLVLGFHTRPTLLSAHAAAPRHPLLRYIVFMHKLWPVAGQDNLFLTG